MGDAEESVLSFNQEFLCGFDRGDGEGPFGPRFHIVHGWRLEGEVDADTLRVALHDVVTRHEALRTRIVRAGTASVQRILPPAVPELEIRDLGPADRDRLADELITEAEAGLLSSQRVPLVRAVLGRFTSRDSVLVLVVHHSMSDGWSVRLIIRDLAACYAARRGMGTALPRPVQYREFAAWQRASAADSAFAASAAFWRDKLADARILSLPTDHPKSAAIPESTAVYRFGIDAGLVSAALDLARATRSTPFMVLLAAFDVLVYRMLGKADLTVPTFSPGRGQERFHGTVGPFLNFLPLRVDLGGCRTFRDVVGMARAACLEAYSHDIPFGLVAGQAPELMSPVLADDRAACVLQVFPFPFLLDGELVGDVIYTEVRRRHRSQPVGSEVPNGALWTLNLDPEGDIVAAIQYNSNLFDESTMRAMVEQYRQVLAEMVRALDAPFAAVSLSRP